MSNTTYGAIKLATAEDVGAVLKKKMGTVNGYKPKEWADTINLLGKLPTRTATGAIAHFTDGADDVPVKSCVLTINPLQTGTGDPSPTNHRPMTGFTGATVCNGLNRYDSTTDESGYLDVVGNVRSSTASKVTDFINVENMPLLALDVGSGSFASGVSNICFYDSNQSFISGSLQTYSIVQNNVYFFEAPITAKYVRFTIDKNNNDSNLQILNGTTYPISWQTEAGTVYGVFLNITTGVLTVTHHYLSGANFVLYGQNTDYNSYKCENVPRSKAVYYNAISNILKTFGSFSAATVNQNICQQPYSTNVCYVALKNDIDINDFEVCYELATPQTYQLTPTEITTLLGVNNIYHDANGDTSVEYRADIDLLITELGG